MTGMKETYPHKYIRNVGQDGADSSDVSTLSLSFMQAILLAGIENGNALVQPNENFVCARFRKKEDYEKFYKQLHGGKAVDFDERDYNLIHTVGLHPIHNPSGDIKHLLEVCELAGLQNFRVIRDDEAQIHVYLSREENPAPFYVMHERLVAYKTQHGIPISTKHDRRETPALKLVQ